MTMLLPKQPRIELPRHLERIRSLPCLICGRMAPSVAAHFRLGLGGGTAMKPHDYWTLPLCPTHHDEQSLCKSGELGFWRKYLAIDKQLVVKVMRAFARSLYEDEMVMR